MSDISINSSSTHVCQSFQTDLNGNDVSDTESATEGYSIFRADSKRGRGCVIFTCGNAHLDCPLRYHSCTFLRCTVDPNPAARDRFPSSRCGLPLTLEYFVIQPIPHKNPSATLLQLPHHLLLVREFNALKACWMELQRAGFSGHFAAALTRALGLGMSSNPPDTAQANYNSSWIGGPNYFSKSRLQEREDELPYRKMRNRCKSEIRQCNTRRQATIIDFARKNNNVLFKYMGHRRRKEPTAFSSTTDYTVNNSVRAPESRMRNNIRSDKESGDSRAARIDGETMLYQANKIRNGEIQCYELLRLNSKFYSYDVSENSSVFRSICSLAYVRFAVSYFKFLFGLQQSKLDRYLLKEMPGLPNTKVEESHFDKKCHSYTTVADGHEVNFSITQDSCGFDLRDRGPKAFAIQPKTDVSSNTLLFANDGDCTRAPRKLLGTTDQYVSSSGKMHIHTTGSNAANPVLQTFAVLASSNQEPLLQDCVVSKSENMDDNSLKNVLTRDADGGDCRLRINVGPGLRINMNVEFTSESTSTYMLLFDGTTCLTEGHLLNQNHKVHIGKSAGGEINILTNAAFIIRYGEISATEPTVNHFELEACTRSSEEEEGAEINETADANSLRLNEFCVYSYKAPRGFKAELSFTSMNLFPELGELHNFLDITGGPYCGVESIDRVGQWPYKKVVSRGPKLCVMLVTDCCHADPWTVTGVFKSTSPHTSPHREHGIFNGDGTVTAVPRATKCGGLLTEKSGVLDRFGYNGFCTWVMVAPPGDIVELVVENLHCTSHIKWQIFWKGLKSEVASSSSITYAARNYEVKLKNWSIPSVAVQHHFTVQMKSNQAANIVYLARTESVMSCWNTESSNDEIFDDQLFSLNASRAEVKDSSKLVTVIGDSNRSTAT
ncbi:hypothetical protein CSKR_100009 [Clonorchis sinensis]|uniref:CUB domain-containing protein n=1 Tax=Clonorchis sinensis TaxID=79923 RepID=A0A8T1M3M0_CLOSI|nr:hypothetical protein CSKR_100009 [Clonorchis sinensis]